MLYCTEIKSALALATMGVKWVKAHDNRTGTRHDYYVFNAPCAFDIETTSFSGVAEFEDGVSCESLATMYEWTLGINFQIVYGRTWDEFIDTINSVISYMNLSTDRRIYIYVRNLAFEFQWICKRFKWESVFAYRERKPIYARTTDGIEFRCSYILSGCSLEETGKKLRREILKRVGDLDYTKCRHSYTPLSDEELGYCETDVLVDMEYIAECIEDEKGNITKIPLTKTGYVRRYVRRECFSNKGDKYAHAKYRKLMNVLQLTLEEYETAKRAFAGGFTHSNVLNTGIIHYNVASYDIASSYPTVMVAEDRFPMSRGRKVHIRSKNEFQWYISRFACVFDVEFENIRSTTRIDHIISASKCYVLENPEIDNGRIISADCLRITVTEIDFEMFSKFYTWATVRVGDLWYYHRGYLPTPFVKSILTLYGNKTTLKGVQGKEDEYMRSKEMCNSAYGMCVTDIIRQDSTYNESWIDTPPDEEKQIEEYNTNPMRFISYLWGVYVTALARRNILSAIISIGDDYIYSDTDSVKFTDLQEHELYFDTYNKWIDERCAVAMDYHNLPFDMTRPRTKDGVEKPLGHFEFEGCYDQFKTLGAKRYALIKDGEFSITVSGVNKKTAVPYLIQKYGITGVMKEFDNDLVIPDHNDLKHDIYDRNGMEITNPCGKLTHLYIDEEFTASITDYRGVECEIHELSCVNLSPAAYSLGIDELYYNLIMHAHDEQNERI